MKFALVLMVCCSLLAADSPDPKLSDAAHAKIRDIQLQQKTIENQYMQLQKQVLDLQNQYNALTAQLDGEVAKAYKETGLKKEEWDFDANSLTFKKAVKKTDEKKP